MSTRSYIGYTKDGNTVNYIYCHWDGYIKNNGKLLFCNYNADNIERLVANGDMSSLADTTKECEFYADRGDAWEEVRPKTCPIEEYKDDEFIEYCYLFNFTNRKWFVREWCGANEMGDWKPLDKFFLNRESEEI